MGPGIPSENAPSGTRYSNECFSLHVEKTLAQSFILNLVTHGPDINANGMLCSDGNQSPITGMANIKGSARNKLDMLGSTCAPYWVETRMGDSLLKDCPFQAFLATPQA